MFGHVRMVSVTIIPLSRALIRPFDVTTPEEDTVGN